MDHSKDPNSLGRLRPHQAGSRPPRQAWLTQGIPRNRHLFHYATKQTFHQTCGQVGLSSLHPVNSPVNLGLGFPLCVSVKCSFWKFLVLFWHS